MLFDLDIDILALFLDRKFNLIFFSNTLLSRPLLVCNCFRSWICKVASGIISLAGKVKVNVMLQCLGLPQIRVWWYSSKNHSVLSRETSFADSWQTTTADEWLIFPKHFHPCLLKWPQVASPPLGQQPEAAAGISSEDSLAMLTAMQGSCLSNQRGMTTSHRYFLAGCSTCWCILCFRSGRDQATSLCWSFLH